MATWWRYHDLLARFDPSLCQARIGQDMPITGVLVFIGADWPLIGGDFATQQVRVVWPKKAEELVERTGPLDEAHIDALHRVRAEALPPT